MIEPITGSGKPPSNRIPVRHALDHLRQYRAAHFGVDPMNFHKIGGEPNDHEFEHCKNVHAEARVWASENIGGCLQGTKIPVWWESDAGKLEPCGGRWAAAQVDDLTAQADRLYFATEDWGQLVQMLISPDTLSTMEGLRADNDRAALREKRQREIEAAALLELPDPSHRLAPPNVPYVTLSHALSSIAFGVSLDKERLAAALMVGKYGDHVPKDAVAAALANLTSKATGGSVEMRGKFRANHNVGLERLSTETIGKEKLADYRFFDHLNDELFQGEGVAWTAGPFGGDSFDHIIGYRGKGSWAQVSVNRADLLQEFSDLEPPTMIVIPLPDHWGTADCKQLPPFLNPFELVAWVQYRDLAVVAKCSSQTGLAAQQIYGTEPKFGRVGDAERALQEDRLIGHGLTKNGEKFDRISAVEWTRIRLAPLDLARQSPYLHIQFARADVLALFPPIESGTDQNRLGKPSPPASRKKPGPAPDPDWPAAIAEVVEECTKAKYARPLERGDLAAIQTRLLTAMAGRGKHPSDDTARKYAAEVIAKLPDKST